MPVDELRISPDRADARNTPATLMLNVLPPPKAPSQATMSVPSTVSDILGLVNRKEVPRVVDGAATLRKRLRHDEEPVATLLGEGVPVTRGMSLSQYLKKTPSITSIRDGSLNQ